MGREQKSRTTTEDDLVLHRCLFRPTRTRESTPANTNNSVLAKIHEGVEYFELNRSQLKSSPGTKNHQGGLSIINTIAFIWRENMLGYLSLDIICSLKYTVYIKLCSWQTVPFSKQIMSADKYPSILLCQMEAIVHVNHKTGFRLNMVNVDKTFITNSTV